MASKYVVHLNQLRVKALSGDRMAQQQLAAELWVPHHNRRSPGLLARIHAKLGTVVKQGLHITAKTKKPMRSVDSVSMDPNYGLDRLQMLVDRRMRRDERLAA